MGSAGFLLGLHGIGTTEPSRHEAPESAGRKRPCVAALLPVGDPHEGHLDEHKS